MIRTTGACLLLAGVICPTGSSRAQASLAIDSVRIQGYVQVQAEFGDATDTRFVDADRMFVRRARLYANGAVARDWEVRIMLDGAPGLSQRRDVPTSLVEAYVRWKRFPAAVIQVGQYKTPFTYEESHSASQLLTVERTLVVDRLKPSRQVGVLLSGALMGEALRYAGGVFNGTGTATNINEDEHFLYVGRVTARLASGSFGTWHVGASGLTSHDGAVPFASEFEFDTEPASPEANALFAGSRTSYAFDTQLRAGRAELWAEYVAAQFTPLNAIPVSEFHPDGWYTLATYFVIPERFQVVGRYETFDHHRVNGPGRTSSVFIGANYYVSRSHDLKLQGGDMISRRSVDDSTAHRFLLRAQLMFDVL